MTTPRLLLIAAAAASIAQASPTTTDALATDLRCEYLVNPVGIDEPSPRLSWRIESATRGQKQSAYQLLVASSPELLARDVGDLWDTGRVESDQSVHLAYAGKPLTAHQACHWKVRAWDKDGLATAWSEAARWSMGVLVTEPAPKPEASEQPGWQGARWIGLEKAAAAAFQSEEGRTRLPARYLRREFTVKRPLARATAHVCGLGFFDLHLNGARVGDHLMDPALSSFDKRAFYVSFELTESLQQGDNSLGVVLGNGRYFGPRHGQPHHSFVENPREGIVEFPKLLLLLRLEYRDGSVEHVASDTAWRATDRGPIRANNEFDGEEYDARLEMPGWDRPGFDDAAWERAEQVAGPGGVLRAQMIQPMRVTEVRKPTAITNPSPGVWLVDMGQSFYGNVRLRVNGPAGTRVQLRCAYNLNPDGSLRARDNRSARSTDVYVLKGGGMETWSPRFRGQAYRFVEVTGFPGTPRPENFEGLVIHTDFEARGGFWCSNPLVNRIHDNIRWTQRAQTRSLPIDPDRDERQGWMGTAARDMQSYACNFLIAPVADKWMGDLRADQLADGHLPDASPVYWWLYRRSIVWPSNIVHTPEAIHDFYADRRILERNYPAMKQWMHFVSRHLKPDFTTDQNRYGDWVDASTMEDHAKDSTKPMWHRDHGETSGPLISTAYLYQNCQVMARFARLLGQSEDQRHFEELAEKIRAGFHQRFFDPASNRYGSGSQTSQLLPLAFDMVPPDKRDAVADVLVRDIMVERKGHLSVGTVGMMWLMQVLTDTGHPEVGWTLATQTTRPSWGYMVGKGATTVWERWDSDTAGPGMNSEGLLILAGNLDAWFYQTLGGIRHDPEQPGFQHILLKPEVPEGLEEVRAWHQSMHGRIVSEWKIADGALLWNVTVPPNTTATIHLPAADAGEVTEGGNPLATAPGVSLLRSDDGRVVCRLVSGRYAFACRRSP